MDGSESRYNTTAQSPVSRPQVPQIELIKSAATPGGSSDRKGQMRLSGRLDPDNSQPYGYLRQNWNAQFQEALHLPSGYAQPGTRIDRLKRIRKIHSDFVEVAEMLGRLIIEELNLPPEKRTIPPEVGIGEAGGVKYIAAGCFFKLQKDGRGLYGGEKYAMKACGAELRALRAIYETATEGICTPLVAMIDYRGYRLLVTSVLPLGSSTLRWGSSDGGQTFHDEHAEIRKLMQGLCERLSLKKHTLARVDKSLDLWGPIDLEIHEGKDGRYYALDVARLMPPTEPPGQVLAVVVPADQSVRLRQIALSEETWLKDAVEVIGSSEAEACIYEHTDSSALVVYHPVVTPRGRNDGQQGTSSSNETPTRSTSNSSLTSSGNGRRTSPRTARSSRSNTRASCFTGIGMHGDVIVVKRHKNSYLYFLLRPEAVLHNPVPLNSEAFSNFRASSPEDETEVRAATRRVVEDEVRTLAAAIERREVLIVNSKQLVSELHHRGINVRYLGDLRAHLSEQRMRAVRSFILIEMISRTIKNILRSQMRNVRSANADDYKEVLVRLFNLVLGSSIESDRYWQWELKIHLLTKFAARAFTEEEASTDHDLREHILSKLALFATLQKHLGVLFLSSTQQQLQEDPTLFEQKAPFNMNEISINSKLYSIPYHQKELQSLNDQLLEEVDQECELSAELMKNAPMSVREESGMHSSGDGDTVTESEEVSEEELEEEEEDWEREERERELRRKEDKKFHGFDSTELHIDPVERGNELYEQEPAQPQVSTTNPVLNQREAEPKKTTRSGSPSPPPTFLQRRSSTESLLRNSDDPDDLYSVYKLRGDELVRLQTKRQVLAAMVFGDKSLEAAVGYFKMAEAESRIENNTRAMELVSKGCEILIQNKQCPVEIVVGFYYLRGTIYERMQQRFKAYRAYLAALETLETVYGDARPQGIGMGHPFGLILCCRLAKMAEEERLFASAFRYGRRFELLWDKFPLPSNSPELVRFVFGSPDYLLSFAHFIDKHEIKNARDEATINRRAIRAWLKQISLFDNYSDINISTHVLQRDILARSRPAYLSKHIMAHDMRSKQRKRRSITTRRKLPLSEKLDATGGNHDSSVKRTISSPIEVKPLNLARPVFGVEGLNEEDRENKKPLIISTDREMHMESGKETQGSLAGTTPVIGGQLWTWGMGRNGKFDRLTRNFKEPRPLSMSFSVALACTITSIACSSSHALLCTSNGQLYTLGANRSGTGPATGVAGSNAGSSSISSNNQLFVPQLVSGVDGHRFVKVACGIGINIAVTAEGRVFAWGGALSRDLGSSEGGLSTYRTPLLLRSMAKHVVVDAACGGAHVLLVTKSGAVFSFGSGEAGALGQGFFTGDIRVPKKILALSDVRATAVAAGEYFSLVLTSEGHVYSFGRGDKGQLGHKRQRLAGYRALTPRRVEGALLSFRVSKIACGHDHSMAITENGDLYLWGSNAHRKLGFRKKKVICPLPKRMDSKYFMVPHQQASPGGSASSSVTSSSSLSASAPETSMSAIPGSKSGSEPTNSKPHRKRTITHIAAGYSHSIAVADGEDLFTWGSAAWAQLGHGDEKQCKHPELVRLLAGSRVLQVVASYGQTMALTASQSPAVAELAHSPKDSFLTGSNRAHADLVAEAAPSLAAIRTMLAEEIQHNVSPLREYADSEGEASPVMSRVLIRHQLHKMRKKLKYSSLGLGLGASHSKQDGSPESHEAMKLHASTPDLPSLPTTESENPISPYSPKPKRRTYDPIVSTRFIASMSENLDDEEPSTSSDTPRAGPVIGSSSYENVNFSVNPDGEPVRARTFGELEIEKYRQSLLQENPTRIESDLSRSTEDAIDEFANGEEDVKPVASPRTQGTSQGNEEEKASESELLLEIPRCFLFRIKDECDALQSIQWSFLSGNQHFWSGILQIVHYWQPERDSLVFRDTTSREVFLELEIHEEGKVPTVLATLDSRRFFVLWPAQHQREALSTNFLGLGFSERIEAFEFEEEVQQAQEPRGTQHSPSGEGHYILPGPYQPSGVQTSHGDGLRKNVLRRRSVTVRLNQRGEPGLVDDRSYVDVSPRSKILGTKSDIINPIRPRKPMEETGKGKDKAVEYEDEDAREKRLVEARIEKTRRLAKSQGGTSSPVTRERATSLIARVAKDKLKRDKGKEKAAGSKERTLSHPNGDDCRAAVATVAGSGSDGSDASDSSSGDESEEDAFKEECEEEEVGEAEEEKDKEGNKEKRRQRAAGNGGAGSGGVSRAGFRRKTRSLPKGSSGGFLALHSFSK